MAFTRGLYRDSAGLYSASAADRCSGLHRDFLFRMGRTTEDVRCLSRLWQQHDLADRLCVPLFPRFHQERPRQTYRFPHHRSDRQKFVIARLCHCPERACDLARDTLGHSAWRRNPLSNRALPRGGTGLKTR